MVTYINKNTRAKYAGDVLDNAPKNVQNGSVYFAMAEGKYYMYDAENDIWHEQMDNGSGGGGEGGTTDHTRLTNRDKPNQHPIGAITGLQEELDKNKTAVLYTPQELTPEQQKQARDNIGATADSEWVTIETFTLEESMAVVKTQEPDGTPYSFDSLRVYIELPDHEKLLLAFKAENLTMWYSFIEPQTKIINLIGTRNNSNFIEPHGYIANTRGGPANNLPPLMSGLDNTFSAPITKLNIYEPLPAGTKITIKAVRQ